MIAYQLSSPLLWFLEAQPYLLYALQKFFGSAITTINQQQSTVSTIDQTRS
ncbi:MULTISPECIES: hypothetical protein [Nostoc]|uniref:hypothetical protein n=1 Tax=Nostoc TaxID=1177 RepID=UPI0003246DD1|nr:MULTISPECIES: hypothetical protein [Nostoc]QHG19685.1 hypothetical protein GJB62_29480 [Nostoc sp. ATCC 53789]